MFNRIILKKHSILFPISRIVPYKNFFIDEKSIVFNIYKNLFEDEILNLLRKIVTLSFRISNTSGMSFIFLIKMR